MLCIGIRKLSGVGIRLLGSSIAVDCVALILLFTHGRFMFGRSLKKKKLHNVFQVWGGLEMQRKGLWVVVHSGFLFFVCRYSHIYHIVSPASTVQYIISHTYVQLYKGPVG